MPSTTPSEFDLVLMLGTLALVAGVALGVRRSLGAWRWALVVPAVLGLPLGTWVVLHASASALEPFSIGCMRHAGGHLPFIAVPCAPEGRVDPGFPARLYVSLDESGVLHVGSEVRSLGELAAMLDREHRLPILLRLDQNTPVLHLVWLLHLVRSAGREEVLLAARKYTWRHEHDPALPGPSPGVRGSWPELEIPLRIRFAEEGRSLTIRAVSEVPRLWGPYENQTTVRMPTSIAYSMGGPGEDQWAGVARWIRESPPDRIACNPKMPVKYLYAIVNECLRAGVPLPALPPFEPPDATARASSLLPYPGRG